MRILTVTRKKIYWLIGTVVAVLLWRNIFIQSGSGLEIPVLKKSFVDGGTNILYGPFVSKAYQEVQSNHSITLATHTSLKNFYYLQIINLIWKSPISVAIWAHGDLTSLVELLYILTRSCAGRQSVVISILVPSDSSHSVDVSQIDWNEILAPNSYTCSQRNIHNKLYGLRTLEPYQNYNSKKIPYPNNRLRNAALHSVKTSHVLVSDIDMMPSINLDEQFMRFLHDSTTKNVKYDTIFVIPVFESSQSQSNQWTVQRLINEWQIGKVRQFYVETCPQCQGPTQYSTWVDRQSSKDSVMASSLLRYVPGWEPFIITKTAMHPKYDERFKQFGYNRMSLICELHMSGKVFQVLDGVFLVHDGFKVEDGFHADKDKELKNNERLYEQFRSELSLKYNTKKHC